MGARGPFYQCSETAHREPREAAALPLPSEKQDPGVPGEYSGAPGSAPPALGTAAEASHDAR